MQKSIRLLLALAVLAGGTGLAMLFRLESDEPASATSGSDVQPVARQPERPADRSEPRPRLAESNSTGTLSSPISGRRAGLPGPARSAAVSEPARTHKIVDGDTLQEISRQYLGSASLAGKIFEANRARLSDPDLLPIGLELTIPSDVGKTSTTKGSPERQPLVPVAPRGRSVPRQRSAGVGPLNR